MKYPPSSPQPERCLILGSNSTDFSKFSLNSSSKIQYSFLSIHGIFNTFNKTFGTLNSDSIYIFASLRFLQGKYFFNMMEKFKWTTNFFHHKFHKEVSNQLFFYLCVYLETIINQNMVEKVIYIRNDVIIEGDQLMHDQELGIQ